MYVPVVSRLHNLFRNLDDLEGNTLPEAFRRGRSGGSGTILGDQETSLEIVKLLSPDTGERIALSDLRQRWRERGVLRLTALQGII